MINASDLHVGQVILREGNLFEIISSDYHSAGGQLGKMVHTRARNIATGHIKEWRFRPEDRVENVELERQEWEYLYADGDLFYFMDPNTYEQFPLEKNLIGTHSKYLVPNVRIQVHVYKGKPVHFEFPPAVLKVTSAPPGHREHDSATLKKVILENGMEVLAPQFITEGEYVRVDPDTGKYVERVHW